MLHPLLLVSAIAVALAQNEPIVETIYGSVQGRTVATHYGINVNSFYGIPYGASTAGERRFEKPIAPEPWDDVFNATSRGRMPMSCTQQRRAVTVITHPFYDNFGEDCLNLNVFTPEDMEPDFPYPVMVYFYGGAYLSGSHIMYPGHFLAARDVIVVVINYRVSIFGFLNTADNSYANAALYDQALSLEWVRDNIGGFGGDPNKVTIFGQSAGASASGLHTVSPVSRGLFHGVIEISGSDNTFWAVNWPGQNPSNYTQQTAVKLGCPTEPDEDMIACLKDADEWELQGNWSIKCTPGHFCQGHGPVVDGPGGFLPDHPLTQRENGEVADVPILGGYNTEDGSIYVVWMIPESLEGGFNRSAFQWMIYDRFAKIWEASYTREQLEDGFRATDFYYTPWPDIHDEDKNRYALVEMVTDAAWGYPLDRQLKLHSAIAPSYWYVFGYRSTNTSTGIWEDTEWAGVPHMGELPYVWGWAQLKLAPEVRRDSRIFIDVVDYNELDFEYSEFMMDLFTNFVKYYNPTPEPISAPNGHGSVTWKDVRQDELNYFYVTNDAIETRKDYRQQQHAYFTEYLSYLLDKQLYAEPSSEGYFSKRPGLDTARLEGSMYATLYKWVEENEPEVMDSYAEWLESAEEDFIGDFL